MSASTTPAPKAPRYLAWMRKEIASHPKLYACFQLVFFCWAIVWWIFPPTADKVLLVLGVLAIIVTIQPQMSDAHRLIWMLIMVILFVVSFRSINKDHADYDRQQAQIRQKEKESFAAILKQDQDHFEATVEELKTVIQNSDRHFDATMQRSNRIVAGVADAVKIQTGGDSFAYITLTGPMSPILTFDKFSHPWGPWMMVAVTSHGKYPLRDVRAVMTDAEAQIAAMQEFNKHPEGDFVQATRGGDTHYQFPYLRPQSPEAPSGDVEVIGTYEVPQGNSKKLSIHFSSLNGYWNEILHLGLVNKQWHQCLSVMGPTIKQAGRPFIWCDSDWPEGKALAEKDWAGITSATQSSNRNK